MNDNQRPGGAEVDLAHLRAIAGHVTDDDFERDVPPASMWSAIAANAGRPANNIAVVPRTRRRVWLGVAAVVVTGLGIAGGLVVSRGARDDVIAETALSNEGLSPLGSASSGKAEIIRRGTSYVLHLDVSRVPSEPASYVEVWLIDRQVKGMISLGPYHGNGDYVIPSGVDPAKFPIVDVSIEPSDGVPTHSGVSIVRGVAAA
ncbi:MAG: anti-sigma factor [Ilumatobacteraceae bacterium]